MGAVFGLVIFVGSARQTRASTHTFHRHDNVLNYGLCLQWGARIVRPSAALTPYRGTAAILMWPFGATMKTLLYTLALSTSALFACRSAPDPQAPAKARKTAPAVSPGTPMAPGAPAITDNVRSTPLVFAVNGMRKVNGAL